LSRDSRELSALFKRKTLEIAGDQMDEIAGLARQEAFAEAKTIMKNAITQAILERALSDMEDKHPESASGTKDAAAGSTARPAEEGGGCDVEDQVSAEIRLIKERIVANEALLSEAPISPEDACASGCYVYGIAGNDRDLPPGDLMDRGIDPANAVYSVSYQDIRAVVSDVSLGEFGEEALASNLNNMDWLTAKVQAHQSVLDRLSRARTVVPMRFCTVYSSECRVQEMLAQQHDYFVDTLARVEGKQEWGVKVYCATQVLADKVVGLSDVVKSLNSELAEKSEAGAYFLKKKIDDAIITERERITDEVVQDSHNRLWMRSWEAVVNRLQGRDVTNRAEDMVLNGAYLVSQDCVEAFQTELDELRKNYAEPGFSYDLSGPWPPYNFAGTAPKEDSADEPVCA